MASFTIVARDFFGNKVSSSVSPGSPAFVFYSNITAHKAALNCLLPKNVSSQTNVSSAASGCTARKFETDEHVMTSGAWNGVAGYTSEYSINYTATRSGQYVHLVQVFRPGGLQAQYFLGQTFSGPSIRSRVDRQISFAWCV